MSLLSFSPHWNGSPLRARAVCLFHEHKSPASRAMPSSTKSWNEQTHVSVPTGLLPLMVGSPSPGALHGSQDTESLRPFREPCGRLPFPSQGQLHPCPSHQFEPDIIATLGVENVFLRRNRLIRHSVRRHHLGAHGTHHHSGSRFSRGVNGITDSAMSTTPKQGSLRPMPPSLSQGTQRLTSA